MFGALEEDDSRNADTFGALEGDAVAPVDPASWQAQTDALAAQFEAEKAKMAAASGAKQMPPQTSYASNPEPIPSTPTPAPAPTFQV